MSFKGYQQLSQERFDIISGRYKKYLDALNDPNIEPVTVFDPLPAKRLEELELIREVSRELQKKKEDDVKKAAQAKLEEEEKAAEQKAAEAKAAAEAAELEEAKKEE